MRLYQVWIAGLEHRVSPAPDFSGTKAEAEAMLREIERTTPELRGKWHCAAQPRARAGQRKREGGTSPCQAPK